LIDDDDDDMCSADVVRMRLKCKRWAKIGELWSINTRNYSANVYPPEVDTVRFAYTGAFEFGPRE